MRFHQARRRQPPGMARGACGNHAEACEPAERQVELDPFDQLALRTDRIERLQQGAQ
jgi:hypothetical protein